MSPSDSGPGSSPGSGSDPILRRWDEVDALFQEALALEPDRREAFLQARCGDDQELLELVRELIHESDSLGGFLDHTAHQEHGTRSSRYSHLLLLPAPIGSTCCSSPSFAGPRGEVSLAPRCRSAWEPRVNAAKRPR